MIIQEVYDTIMQMRDETTYAKFKPNKEKIIASIEYCMNSGFLYFNGKCLMMGKSYTPWHGDELCACDVLLYTKAEYRGNGEATKAVEAFIDWAKSIGADDIKLGQTTGIKPEEFNNLAKRYGMKKIGETYHV